MKRLILEIVIYFVEVISVLFFFSRPIFLAVFLCGTSIVYLLILKRSDFVSLYFLAAVIGPVAEFAAIRKDAWVYTYSTVFNLPMWLPFAWGIVVLFITRICETIREIKVVRSKNAKSN